MPGSDAQLPDGPLAKVAYGFTLPFALLREVRADSELAPLHRREVRRQWLIVGALSVLFSSGSLSALVAALDAGGTVVESKRGVALHFGAEKVELRPIDHTDDEEEERTSVLLVLGTIWGTLKLVDWLVAAFLREHDDALTHALSVKLGAVAEPAIEQPRIRFSFKWALRRLKRKARGALVIGLLAPVVVLASLLPAGEYLQGALTTAWAFYWLGVFTASKSSAAWTDGEAPVPWFLRGWGTLASRGPLRWWFFRLYHRMLERTSKELHGPCAAFALAPYEFAGLAVVRVLAGLPLASSALRAVLPVAAGQILARR